MAANTTYYLRELQSAKNGRKTSRSDPRYLDPSPVVEVLTAQGDIVVNNPYADDPRRLRCTVDFFRVPDAGAAQHGEFTYYVPAEAGGDALVLHRAAARPAFRYRTCVEGVHFVTDAALDTGDAFHGEKCAVGVQRGGTVVFIFARLSGLKVGRFVPLYTLIGPHGRLAEYFGAPITIHPQELFPGYQPATPLTQSFAYLNHPGLRTRRR